MWVLSHHTVVTAYVSELHTGLCGCTKQAWLTATNPILSTTEGGTAYPFILFIDQLNLVTFRFTNHIPLLDYYCMQSNLYLYLPRRYKHTTCSLSSAFILSLRSSRLPLWHSGMQFPPPVSWSQIHQRVWGIGDWTADLLTSGGTHLPPKPRLPQDSPAPTPTRA